MFPPRWWSRAFAPRNEPLLRDLSLFLLRLWFGANMLVRSGWPKIDRFLEDPSNFRDPLGLGPELSLLLVIFAEVICAALVVIGLATRLATLPLIFTMFVAGMLVHTMHLSALSYLFAYLVIFLLGPGRWSLDHLWWRRRGTVTPG